MSEGAPNSWNWPRFALGTAAGVLFALGGYLLAGWLQPHSGLLLIAMLLIPPAAGAVAVLAAGVRSPAQAAVIGAAVITVLMAVAAVVFREGVICLVMAAPIFYPLGVAGAAATVIARGKRGGRSSTSFAIVAPLLLLPIEQQSAYPTMVTSVTTQIEIAAPVAVVWDSAIEIRDIAPEEQSWTVTHALLNVPRPVDARLSARNGALVREASWAGGVRFYEAITAQRRNESLAWAFDIPEQAANRLLDEHLRLDEGYLRLIGGRYAFEALSPTRTRLTLTTHYAARTPLNLYARAWGALVLGDIHRNVLGIVRHRAEAARENS